MQILSILLTITLAIINFLYSFKNKREALRNSNMPKYKIIDPHFVKIKKINLKYFVVNIKNVGNSLVPFTCIILKFKINDETKYFRSGIISYLEKEKLFEFCLPKDDDLKFDTFFILSKDENGVTYVKEYVWESDKAKFKKNKLFGRKNKKFEIIINSAIVIDQDMYPCKEIVENFKAVNDFYNHPDHMEQMINSGSLFKNSQQSIDRIEQLLSQNPDIFQQ